MQKNLDLIFSILDLEISIPDLENSKRAFRKKTPNFRKIYPFFRQFFVKIFAKKSVLKFWQNKSDFPVFCFWKTKTLFARFLSFKKFVIPLWAENKINEKIV